MPKKPPRRSTALISHDYRPPAGFVSVHPVGFKASTIVFPNVAAVRARNWREKTGYTYGLHGTPTTFTLEERIATLEGGVQTLLVPSGLAAITLVGMALLKSGDELLDPASLAAATTERTRLVWIEAPGSVTMEFPDLVALIGAARAGGAT